MSSPRLSRDARALYEMLCKSLHDAGVNDHQLDFRGKHPALVFTWGGRSHRVSFSLTPSDQRTALNTRSTLRKILAQSAP